MFVCFLLIKDDSKPETISLMPKKQELNYTYNKILAIFCLSDWKYSDKTSTIPHSYSIAYQDIDNLDLMEASLILGCKKRHASESPSRNRCLVLGQRMYSAMLGLGRERKHNTQDNNAISQNEARRSPISALWMMTCKEPIWSALASNHVNRFGFIVKALYHKSVKSHFEFLFFMWRFFFSSHSLKNLICGEASVLGIYLMKMCSIQRDYVCRFALLRDSSWARSYLWAFIVAPMMLNMIAYVIPTSPQTNGRLDSGSGVYVLECLPWGFLFYSGPKCGAVTLQMIML